MLGSEADLSILRDVKICEDTTPANDRDSPDAAVLKDTLRELGSGDPRGNRVFEFLTIDFQKSAAAPHREGQRDDENDEEYLHGAQSRTTAGLRQCRYCGGECGFRAFPPVALRLNLVASPT